jgi:hypothetical protein
LSESDLDVMGLTCFHQPQIDVMKAMFLISCEVSKAHQENRIEPAWGTSLHVMDITAPSSSETVVSGGCGDVPHVEARTQRS